MKLQIKLAIILSLFLIALSVHADTNQNLIAAAFKGDINTVRSLLNKGADVNRKNKYGTTALQQAVVMNHKHVVKLLIEKGADVNAKNNEGNTILINAAWSSSKDIIKLLIEKGADVNAKNNRGGTALVHAVSGGNKNAIQLLKQAQQDRAITNLASDDAKVRYFAIRDLSSMRTLPEPVLNMLIDYLDDLRGQYPGNTVAGAAAERLAQHPRQAERAIPQLLELLSYTEKYGLPSGSAAEALTAIKRPALEKYLMDLSAEHRKTLAATMAPVLRSGAGSYTAWALVTEVMGMLGPDASAVIPDLKNKCDNSKREAATNPFAHVLRVRCETALRIISNGWRAWDPGYYGEMKRADTALGKLDPYVVPEKRFTTALDTLIRRMKAANITKAYVLRKEDTFPFYLSEGLPLAKLIQNNGYRYLYGSDDGKGKQLPNVPLILLTRASKEVYHKFHFSRFDPPYSPLVPDFAFIEMGVNGYKPFDQMLKTLKIPEGYREDRLYEFWPSEWWPNGGTLRGGFLVREGVKIIWIVLANGDVINGVYIKGK